MGDGDDPVDRNLRVLVSFLSMGFRSPLETRMWLVWLIRCKVGFGVRDPLLDVCDALNRVSLDTRNRVRRLPADGVEN